MNPFSALTNAAGGLSYHLLARARSRHWHKFRRQLEAWLLRLPVCQNLVLIGPSGGHCLTQNFLQRYDQLLLVDPDPLAHYLFRRRHQRRTTRRSTYLQPLQLGSFFEGYNDLPHHDTLFLFCNVLGQLTVLAPQATLTPDGQNLSPAFRQSLDTFNQVASNHRWASFHDRLSSPQEPATSTPFASHLLDLDDLVARLYIGGQNDGKEVTVRDHHTHVLAPQLRRHHLCWPLRADSHHLIECLSPLIP